MRIVLSSIRAMTLGDLRLEILNDKEGVWRCRTTFNCTEACPRGIQITKAIAEVKQAIFGASPLSLAVGELAETQDMRCGRKVGVPTPHFLFAILGRTDAR